MRDPKAILSLQYRAQERQNPRVNHDDEFAFWARWALFVVLATAIPNMLHSRDWVALAYDALFTVVVLATIATFYFAVRATWRAWKRRDE
jgi:hypothetical protein